jgi:hypothetical protein
MLGGDDSAAQGFLAFGIDAVGHQRPADSQQVAQRFALTLVLQLPEVVANKVLVGQDTHVGRSS